MSNKKQSDVKQPGWLCKVWLWVQNPWDRLLLVVLAIATPCICLFYLSPEQRVANNHTWLQLYLGTLAVTGGLVLYKPQIITSSSEKYFITRVLTTGITGGAFALLLPIAVKSTTTGVGGLRHSILLATGGLLAILTLGETRRKNNIDKRKNKQEKEKNDKDHRRQVRAERRERYTKAVEQLGDEKAPIRMGGVYTLVGLVDEWLEEKNLDYSEKLKEGQVIVNNLCAYIRSPFTLASHYDELYKTSPTSKGIYKGKKEKFYADKATLDSEADVRLSIIKEIHDRLQGSDKNRPGVWSDFEYDFSGSTFFYPIDLTKSYYKKPVNFTDSTYKGQANFSDSTYKGQANFSDSTYKGQANFSDSTYKGQANFSDSTYKGQANFSDSTYKGQANFSDSTYKGQANFSRCTYKGGAYFARCTYKGGAYFARCTYKGTADFVLSIYKGTADFSDSTYKGGAYFALSIYKGTADFSDSTYKGTADFALSTYKGTADFSDSTYKGGADFALSIYKGQADFSDSTYQSWTYFSESIFYNDIYFGQDGDNSSFSRFTDCTPQFYDETNHKYTLFGSLDNNFTVENGRGYPIYRNLEGLPLGCKFLTSEWRESLEDKFQEIEETNNKLLEAKYPKEKAKLSKKLRALNEELHEWRDAITTVIVESCIISDQIIPREF
ncbi:pentapeptide repeat-containing protein [Rothia dentocariosa]|uniref:pentapeptide repeat-containing protein n=1 Tax=Rothia dentocariosa TaxID=2047 RepID=UPI00211BF10B|nr:pentapeptide repeat-containing protein [Rothia dentocariosa]